ncbi:MAG TPA: SUF system NifU family Fe-S cluster assembly protein [Gammaproteobacteria bacterium]|nr:SUF system NifU family Fe-S cluster assembly protein [Gammaproteobacteria bacterium]
MITELRELYQEVIVEHGSKPRFFYCLDAPSCTGHGYNPLCGDQITLYLKMENQIIAEMGFQGQGCAISIASASLMCEALNGKPIIEAELLFQQFHRLLTTDEDPSYELGKLTVLSGVREFPARVKCATLAWHTLQNALENIDVLATTE